MTQDWRGHAAALIKTGEIEFWALSAVVGKESAIDLFARAGVMPKANRDIQEDVRLRAKQILKEDIAKLSADFNLIVTQLHLTAKLLEVDISGEGEST